MATGNALITAVASELNRTDLDTTGAQVAASQRALNDTLRDFLNRHPFSWRIVQPPLSITTIAGTSVYTLSAAPTSTKIQDIFAVILDTGDLQTRELRMVPHGRFLRDWPNLAYQATNKPIAVTRRDQYAIEVAPRPDTATYTLKVYYSLEFTDITTFTAELSQIPQRATEVVKVGMLMRLYRWLQEWPTAVGMLALYEQQIKSLIDEEKAHPSQEFLIQPVLLTPAIYRVNYWQSPFVG